MKEDWKKWLSRATNLRSERKSLYRKRKQDLQKDLDRVVRTAHQGAFREVTCLECGNCCKTTSPDIRESDLSRLAAALHLRPVQVIERYLLKDGSGYVVNQSPCPFLGPDNYCSVYESRPSACRDFPHTDRKNQWSLLDLSLQNSTICPAVARIFDELDKHIKKGA